MNGVGRAPAAVPALPRQKKMWGLGMGQGGLPMASLPSPLNSIRVQPKIAGSHVRLQNLLQLLLFFFKHLNFEFELSVVTL